MKMSIIASAILLGTASLAFATGAGTHNNPVGGVVHGTGQVVGGVVKGTGHVVGGVVKGTGHVVGGVVKGAGQVVGGVVRGTGDVLVGTGNALSGRHNMHHQDNHHHYDYRYN
jgi:hypothetical protein